MQIRDQILARVNKKKKSSDNLLVQLHDSLMAEYGWIPFEEFKKLPIQTVLNLLEQAEIRHKAQEPKGKRR